MKQLPDDIAKGFIKRFESEPKNAVKELAGYILENRLHGQVEDILLAIRDEYTQIHGFIEANARTPHLLSSELKTKLIQRVKNVTGARKVSLHEQIDKSILGGVIVEAPGMQLDLSLKSKLAKLKA